MVSLVRKEKFLSKLTIAKFCVYKQMNKETTKPNRMGRLVTNINY